MLKNKTKFKVGDKVRILPSAINGGVSEKAIGKIGTIVAHCRGVYFEVIMDKNQDTGPNPHLPWAVYHDQIKLVIIKGQQLLLWEDIFE